MQIILCEKALHSGKNKKKQKRTYNKAIIKRNWATQDQWLKDASLVNNTLYEHSCIRCQKYFQNALIKLKSYQQTESPKPSRAPLNQLSFLNVKPTFHFLQQLWFGIFLFKREFTCSLNKTKCATCGNHVHINPSYSLGFCPLTP